MQQGTQGEAVSGGNTLPPMAGGEGYIPGCGEGRRGDGGPGCISISHNGDSPLITGLPVQQLPDIP